MLSQSLPILRLNNLNLTRKYSPPFISNDQIFHMWAIWGKFIRSPVLYLGVVCAPATSICVYKTCACVTRAFTEKNRFIVVINSRLPEALLSFLDTPLWSYTTTFILRFLYALLCSRTKHILYACIYRL